MIVLTHLEKHFESYLGFIVATIAVFLSLFNQISDNVFQALMLATFVTLTIGMFRQRIAFDQLSTLFMSLHTIGEASESIWTEEKTKKVEENAESLWSATRDLAFFVDPAWHDIIFNNVTRRRVKTYIIYLGSEENREIVDSFTKELEKLIGIEWKSIIHFQPITRDEFYWYAEHVVYNPDRADEHCIVVNIMGDRSVNYFNIELSPRLRLIFKNQFEKMWNEKSPEKLQKP